MKIPVITLTTDFGHKSPYAGIMKGAILGICPKAQIVDLTHDIGPQNILEAQFALAQSVPFFPKGAIHVAVVDPGVGSNRRPILLKSADGIFVGPDNGIFTPWLARAETRKLENKKYFHRKISNTFHGRDIFAPVAAHIAKGVSLKHFGPVIVDPLKLNIPAPRIDSKIIQGEIIAIDSFGNAVSNIPSQLVNNIKNPLITAGGKKIKSLVKTYSDANPGQPCALVGSHGYVEIAIPEKSAAASLKLEVGSKVKIEFKKA